MHFNKNTLPKRETSKKILAHNEKKTPDREAAGNNRIGRSQAHEIGIDDNHQKKVVLFK